MSDKNIRLHARDGGTNAGVRAGLEGDTYAFKYH